MYNQIDMDFKQTIKKQKQQQGEIYNHLLNIQHYMKRETLAYNSNFKFEMDGKTIQTLTSKNKWLRIICNKLQNVDRIKYY
jgi:hypothetical protein